MICNWIIELNFWFLFFNFFKKKWWSFAAIYFEQAPHNEVTYEIVSDTLAQTYFRIDNEGRIYVRRPLTDDTADTGLYTVRVIREWSWSERFLNISYQIQKNGNLTTSILWIPVTFTAHQKFLRNELFLTIPGNYY